MSNRKYISGARFERRVRDWLKEQGWLVWRTPGSKSPCDLIATRGGEWVLYQCQTGLPFPHQKIENLKIICDEAVCGGMLVWRDDKNKIKTQDVYKLVEKGG